MVRNLYRRQWKNKMKAYQHILLTTDFSKFSEVVARKAVTLAGHFNARITLLHVVKEYPQENTQANETLESSKDEDLSKNIIADNRQRLEAFARSIPILRMIPMITLSKESTEDVIIKVARDIKADLVIMGEHEENSVSISPELDTKKVQQKAPCDVLVVHADAA
ncbi:universal stress protein [Cocleimonas sp. KMM 6895]|nr:universal stress protein [Cocleimonas sp. KMM 6895]